MKILDQIDAGMADVKNLDHKDIYQLLKDARIAIVTLDLLYGYALLELGGADPNHH